MNAIVKFVAANIKVFKGVGFAIAVAGAALGYVVNDAERQNVNENAANNFYANMNVDQN